jgi:CRISPR-associated protein Cas2
MENYIWNEEETTHKKQLVLIIYDIVDTKKRTKFAKAMEGFGFRVQKSAFEARLNASQLERLRRAIPPLIDEACDSVRIYRMTSFAKVHLFGQNIKVEDEEVMIV